MTHIVIVIQTTISKYLQTSQLFWTFFEIGVKTIPKKINYLSYKPEISINLNFLELNIQ